MLKITPETPIAALTVGQFTELFFSNKTSIPRSESQHSESQIFGIDECKKLTGYSSSAIYQRTSKNEIPHFKRDGKILFRRDEIISWMTENRVKTQSEQLNELDQRFVGRRAK
jgi:predicted DNA-binding transcriptional regulator AlpA